MGCVYKYGTSSYKKKTGATTSTHTNSQMFMLSSNICKCKFNEVWLGNSTFPAPLFLCKEMLTLGTWGLKVLESHREKREKRSDCSLIFVYTHTHTHTHTNKLLWGTKATFALLLLLSFIGVNQEECCFSISATKGIKWNMHWSSRTQTCRNKMSLHCPLLIHTRFVLQLYRVCHAEVQKVNCYHPKVEKLVGRKGNASVMWQYLNKPSVFAAWGNTQTLRIVKLRNNLHIYTW